jgi:hypothetical protein
MMIKKLHEVWVDSSQTKFSNFLFARKFIFVISSSNRMAHWFHRNPLKATAQQNFELKMFAHEVDAIRVSRCFFFFETKALNFVEYLLTPSCKQDCFTFKPILFLCFEVSQLTRRGL